MPDLLTTQFLPLAQLSPNTGQVPGLPKNPRFIRDNDFANLVASIRDYPEMMAMREVLVYPHKGTYVIIGGNMRYRACKELGYSEVPCKVLPEDTPVDRLKAYVVKDNGSSGSWSMDDLANEWSDLPLTDWGVDLPEDWLAEPEAEPEEDDYNGMPPAEPVTVLGDLYELNGHRVLCGDSTEVDIVAKTLNGAAPVLMVTDPPYGVVYDANWRNKAMRADGSSIAGRAIGKVLNDDKVDWSLAYALFPGQVCYVWHADRHASEVCANLQDNNFNIVCQIIWAKSNFAIGRGDYHWKHEPCWYAVREGKTHNWQGSRSETTLWEINKPQKSETGHSTQKPIECMARPIQNNSKQGEGVYDPFLGSGTTLLAAEQLNRVCYGQELNPAYVDVIVKRWVAYMVANNRPYTVKRNGVEITADVWLTAQ